MKIENQFIVDLPPAEAWRVLLDVPAIVPCMPGAELLADEGGGTYVGRVKAKLGPVAVEFRGKAQFVDINETAHSVRVKAYGNEVKGRGNASAEVMFHLTPQGAGTRVNVETDVNLAGAVAQYGRAQGVIAGVAQVLIDQFAKNLRARISADARGERQIVDPARVSSPASLGRDVAAQISQPSTAPPVKGISVFSLLFIYIRSLFSSKRSAS
ncbi:carbon monoxide dehydrogenase subunit G [Bradyrhizobium sp. AZCC 1678]|uniref:SRPBCC family protein n=1 Tax=Bradyrhizobium sp. AZCC 1678 TaxID=3117030 RepID=UPI002FEEF434